MSGNRFWVKAEIATRAIGMGLGMLAPAGIVIGGVVGAFMTGGSGAIIGAIVGAPVVFAACLLCIPVASFFEKLDRLFNKDVAEEYAAKHPKVDTQSLFPLKSLTRKFEGAKETPAVNVAAPVSKTPEPPAP